MPRTYCSRCQCLLVLFFLKVVRDSSSSTPGTVKVKKGAVGSPRVANNTTTNAIPPPLLPPRSPRGGTSNSSSANNNHSSSSSSSNLPGSQSYVSPKLRESTGMLGDTTLANQKKKVAVGRLGPETPRRYSSHGRAVASSSYGKSTVANSAPKSNHLKQQQPTKSPIAQVPKRNAPGNNSGSKSVSKGRTVDLLESTNPSSSPRARTAAGAAAAAAAATPGRKPISARNGTTFRERMSNATPHDNYRQASYQRSAENAIHRNVQATPVSSPTVESTEAAMLREHELAYQKKPSQDSKSLSTTATKRRNSGRERPPPITGGFEGESTEEAMMREHGRPPSFREKSTDNHDADVNVWKLQQDVAAQVKSFVFEFVSVLISLMA